MHPKSSEIHLPYAQHSQKWTAFSGSFCPPPRPRRSAACCCVSPELSNSPFHIKKILRLQSYSLNCKDIYLSAQDVTVTCWMRMLLCRFQVQSEMLGSGGLGQWHDVQPWLEEAIQHCWVQGMFLHYGQVCGQNYSNIRSWNTGYIFL